MAQTSLLASLSTELAALVRGAAPRLISIAGRPHRPATALAIGADLVLAADHTIEREQDITATVDGTVHEAALLGRDPATDLAVLRVTGLDTPPLSEAAIPPAGSLVVSVSRTASGTVSTGFGVITSVGGPLRTRRGVVLPAIIRTDAALRPGTAGGALVGADGHILAVTTPGLLRGLPVAIPITEALAIARRLAAHEPLRRAYLGVNVQPVRLVARQREQAGGDTGLLVSGVAPGSAAERAGLLIGDVLLRFNDRSVAEADELQDDLARLSPGTQVPVTVLRAAEVQQLTVTVGERPAA